MAWGHARNYVSSKRKALAETDDRDGLDGSVDRKRRRYLLGQKCTGIHWPVWLIKQVSAKTKPRVKRAVTFDGVPGFLLDPSYGEPLGTKRVLECVEDGCEIGLQLGNSKRVATEQLKDLYNSVESSRTIKVKAKGKVCNSENAPIAFGLETKVAPYLNPS